MVTDPERPVKMSGNVSELPAFTGRTLFIDHPSYLTTPYPDTQRRQSIARQLVDGGRSNSEDAAYLWRVRRTYLASGEAPRPVYLITYRADRTDIVEKMTAANGAPVFRNGLVAVFQLPERSVLPGRD